MTLGFHCYPLILQKKWVGLEAISILVRYIILGCNLSGAIEYVYHTLMSSFTCEVFELFAILAFIFPKKFSSEGSSEKSSKNHVASADEK